MRSYSEFRKYFDQTFKDHKDSVSQQLFSLTDLYQKVAAIYKFAGEHKNTAFKSPLIFQMVETALFYGVCLQIRRLVDGGQKNEISLFKILQEFKTECVSWRREEFVTFNGLPYDPTELKKQHLDEEQKILERHLREGRTGGWLPIGKHEEVYRRHRMFDLMCGIAPNNRAPNDTADNKLPIFLLNTIPSNSEAIIRMTNTYLAHRILYATGQAPNYRISVSDVEDCVSKIWMVFNVLNALFYDNYTTPQIIHSLLLKALNCLSSVSVSLMT